MLLSLNLWAGRRNPGGFPVLEIPNPIEGERYQLFIFKGSKGQLGHETPSVQHGLKSIIAPLRFIILKSLIEGGIKRFKFNILKGFYCFHNQFALFGNSPERKIYSGRNYFFARW